MLDKQQHSIQAANWISMLVFVPAGGQRHSTSARLCCRQQHSIQAPYLINMLMCAPTGGHSIPSRQQQSTQATTHCCQARAWCSGCRFYQDADV